MRNISLYLDLIHGLLCHSLVDAFFDHIFHTISRKYRLNYC